MSKPCAGIETAYGDDAACARGIETTDRAMVTLVPTSPGIAFLHGFLGCPEDAGPIAERLGVRFVAPALPGHGSGPLSAEALEIGAVARAILDDLGPAPWILVGYSLGGRIALAAALERPDAVAGLVLESASPGIGDVRVREDRLRRDRELARDLLEDGLDAFLERWSRLPLFASLRKHPELLEAVTASRRSRLDPARIARVLVELSPGAVPDRWPRLGEIRVPVLAVAGELDPGYVEIATEIAKRVPEGTLATIPGAGHNTHLEAPDAFVSTLRRWLAERFP